MRAIGVAAEDSYSRNASNSSSRNGCDCGGEAISGGAGYVGGDFGDYNTQYWDKRTA